MSRTRPNDDTVEEGQQSNITRTVGYTKPDGTTATYEAYVAPDGSMLTYERGSVLIIPEYENRVQAAAQAADQDALDDAHQEYEEARRQAVQRLHDRAAQRAQEDTE